MQNRLTAPSPLLNKNGALAATGYATEPLLQYDRALIHASRLRIKEWDYYLVYDEEKAVALTIADNGYMGLLSASVLFFGASPREHTKSEMTFFPLGKTQLPATSKKGDVTAKSKNAEFSFFNNGETRRISCHMGHFWDEKTLDVSLTLGPEPSESMVIATPFLKKENAFYYNQKINCLPADGSITLGSETYTFSQPKTFGVLDWGRGVWTYKNTWYWGSASGLLNGAPFGFNIGCGFGDTRAATENMLFYQGKAHKLDQVFFHIPQKDGKDDYLSDWLFSSSDGRFEMQFHPVLDRFADTNALVLRSLQHQVFGYFSGYAVLDDGTVLKPDHFLGFAEKVFNKW
ncbi:MAG: DUF2804 domain-containing protein [Oscillospiraceae bacterium]|nr:DUF2804 domain-containing protein [Oscillospiraceae bacterium]